MSTRTKQHFEYKGKTKTHIAERREEAFSLLDEDMWLHAMRHRRGDAILSPADVAEAVVRRLRVYFPNDAKVNELMKSLESSNDKGVLDWLEENFPQCWRYGRNHSLLRGVYEAMDSE